MARLIGCFFTLFFTFNLFTYPVLAKTSSNLTLKQGAPATYVVVKGDTLWDISAMYLNDPWLWPKLWDINAEIENPHLIYPGDQLYLVWNNGQPQLKFKPKVTMTPKVRKVKKQPLPIVRKGLVLPYLQSDRLVDNQVIEQSSRVIGNSEGRQYIAQQGVVYFTGQHTHALWGIYRKSNQFRSGKHRMTALRLIALGEKRPSEQSMSALQLTKQSQEVMQNDIVLPLVDMDSLKLTTTFFPYPAPKNIKARILGGLEAGKYFAQNQVVVIDSGAEDGLKQGCMFSIYQSGSSVFGSEGDFSYEEGWFKEKLPLPDNKVGEMMVIRPFDQFSLVLITHSKSAIDTEAVAFSPLADDFITELPR